MSGLKALAKWCERQELLMMYTSKILIDFYLYLILQHHLCEGILDSAYNVWPKNINIKYLPQIMAPDFRSISLILRRYIKNQSQKWLGYSHADLLNKTNSESPINLPLLDCGRSHMDMGRMCKVDRKDLDFFFL